MRKDRYPWEIELEDQEWQCVYCGRFMDDPKAVRRAFEEGYKLDACIACHLFLRMARLETLEGRQRRIKEVLKIEHAPYDGYRMYVNREGVGRVKVQKGKRVGGKLKLSEFGDFPPPELPDPYHGLLDVQPGPKPDPVWLRVLEDREKRTLINRRGQTDTPPDDREA